MRSLALGTLFLFAIYMTVYEDTPTMATTTNKCVMSANNVDMCHESVVTVSMCDMDPYSGMGHGEMVCEPCVLRPPPEPPPNV